MDIKKIIKKICFVSILTLYLVLKTRYLLFRNEKNNEEDLVGSNLEEDGNGYNFYTLSDKNVNAVYDHRHRPSLRVIKDACDPVLLSMYYNASWEENIKAEEEDGEEVLTRYQKLKERWFHLLYNKTNIYHNLQNKPENPQKLFSRVYVNDVNYIPFTQGLQAINHTTLIESTGLYYGSILRTTRISDGETLKYIRLPNSLFGEGLAFLYVTNYPYETVLHTSRTLTGTNHSLENTLSKTTPTQQPTLNFPEIQTQNDFKYKHAYPQSPTNYLHKENFQFQNSYQIISNQKLTQDNNQTNQKIQYKYIPTSQINLQTNKSSTSTYTKHFQQLQFSNNTTSYPQNIDLISNLTTQQTHQSDSSQSKYQAPKKREAEGRTQTKFTDCSSNNIPGSLNSSGFTPFSENFLYLLQLTYKENVLIVYSYPDLLPIITFAIPFDGWGLVSNFDQKALSDSLNSPSFTTIARNSTNRKGNAQAEAQINLSIGSNPLHIGGPKLWATNGEYVLIELDAVKITKTIQSYISDMEMNNCKHIDPLSTDKYTLIRLPILKITDLMCNNKPLWHINELEYNADKNTIFGNKFQTFEIYEIDPETGTCTNTISFDNLTSGYEYSRKNIDNVLNGIAFNHYDNMARNSSFPSMYVTGKRWEKLYSI